jgi:hypothetical protein
MRRGASASTGEVIDGHVRERVRRAPGAEWYMLMEGHHPGYIGHAIPRQPTAAAGEPAAVAARAAAAPRARGPGLFGGADPVRAL